MDIFKKHQLTSIVLFILLFSTVRGAFSAETVGPLVHEDSNKLNFESCKPIVIEPDFDLVPSSEEIDIEINYAVEKFREIYLGNPVNASKLANAVSKYEDFNINVDNSSITGKKADDLSDFNFIRVFARHLRTNPNDSEISSMFNNLVWWASQEICNGNLDPDVRGYDFRHFGRSTALMREHLTPEVQELFVYVLQKTTNNFIHFWTADYDIDHQIENDAIDTDQIYNKANVLLAFSLWHDNKNERYRYMKGFKRYMERFLSYSSGTTNGIKTDGSGFHHWTAYNNYMYSYNTAIEVLSYLDDTRFQIEKQNYLVFRDAVLIQYLQANDELVQALGNCGRKPQERENKITQSNLKLLAISGGKILELETADPVLAGMYNRIYGVDVDFNTDYIAPFTSGFVQQNYGTQGFYRMEEWLAVSKGFTNGLWGTEIYPKDNRYGRYQSYGSLEVLYPGDGLTGNGINIESWNWNYIPGATTIVLPWAALHGEKSRIDEQQQKSFVGSLMFRKSEKEYLQNTMGQFGMFAMDFQEQEGQGFGTVFNKESHNSSFKFKKSNFFFDNYIICLASGINNDDVENNTVTTLFQRMDNTGLSPIINGSEYPEIGITQFDGGDNNWTLSNYGTGFYLMPGNHKLYLNKTIQQTPNHNQVWPASIGNNKTEVYYSGYLDHGKNPNSEGYEYMILPNSSEAKLNVLHDEVIQGKKPYTVHRKDQDAHIIEHHGQNIMAFAFFSKMWNVDIGFIKSVDKPCMIMSSFDTLSNILSLSIVNPDLGLQSRSYAPVLAKYIELTLQGEWEILDESNNIKFLSYAEEVSKVQFLLEDGLPQVVKLQQKLTSSNNSPLNSEFVKIYPNPTRNYVQISSTEPIQNLQLYDIGGKNLFVSEFRNLSTTQKMDLSKLGPGIYFVKVKTKSGFAIKKLVNK
jgi:chondroitin-sulfate-ABC endolyase/exolyase